MVAIIEVLISSLLQSLLFIVFLISVAFLAGLLFRISERKFEQLDKELAERSEE